MIRPLVWHYPRDSITTGTRVISIQRGADEYGRTTLFVRLPQRAALGVALSKGSPTKLPGMQDICLHPGCDDDHTEA